MDIRDVVNGIKNMISKDDQDQKSESDQPVIDFFMRGLKAETILKEYVILTKNTRSILDRFNDMMINNCIPCFAFLDGKDSRGSKIIRVDSSFDFKENNIWFIGDLHGDILGLEAGIEHIRNFDKKSGKKSLLVFLGDFFDDDGYNALIMLKLFGLIIENKSRICLLAGNHDEGLSHDGSSFSSSVDPCNFAQELNSPDGDIGLMNQLGLLTIEIFRLAPRAIFFPDGLFAAHGGFPLSDRWEHIKKPEDLNAEECLEDFVWTRAHGSAPRKRPNRTSRGCQFGYQDFEGFCQKATEMLGQPVSKMIRGHDHIEERYAIYRAFSRDSILTVNTLSRKLSREIFGEFERVPCIALYRCGQLPEVHRLHIDAETIRKIYPLQYDSQNPQGNGAASGLS
jgi:hypothetical protein